MTKCIQRAANEVLRVSKGESGRMKGAWWWSEEVKKKVKTKQEKYKASVSSRTDGEKKVNKVQYRIAKKVGKESSGGSKKQYL